MSTEAKKPKLDTDAQDVVPNNNHATRWDSLPHHILLAIFQYLPNWSMRFQASLVCTRWHSVYKSPILWQYFVFNFKTDHDATFLKLLDSGQQGQHVKNFVVNVWQKEQNNRNNACTFILKIAQSSTICVESFMLKFCGENPLLYAGADFVGNLHILFRSQKSIQSVAIKAPIRVDEYLMGTLFTNNKDTLKCLDILNNSMFGLVSSACIGSLISSAPRLREIKLKLNAISNEVLDSLSHHSAGNQTKLLFLGCNREEKFSKLPNDEAWAELMKLQPNLTVGFHFDHRCLIATMKKCLRPQIRVSEVHFMTYTSLIDELEIVGRYYPKTLRSISVMGQAGKQLDEALISLSKKCKSLTQVRVVGTVSKLVADQFRSDQGAGCALHFTDITGGPGAALVDTAHEDMIEDGDSHRH